MLSPEASAEPGQWYTARAEYQRGIMDAFSDPLTETIVIMSSSQIGKTEIINNIVGYFIDQDPSPMLVVLPTVEIGQAWSKDRLAPMLRDTPCLQGKVKDPRSRDSGNTILHKVFKGGHLTVSGANSPASLSSRPVRVVLCDEVDRFPVSAGPEGDPVRLASKRTANFWNRKKALTSSPTVKNASRIEAAYEASDKRRYKVPCPHCGEKQVLIWGQVKWEKAEDGKVHKPETAYYECEKCRGKITDADKIRMIRLGEWVPEKVEFAGTAGFHINELYSPWSTFAAIVRGFLEAKGDPVALKTWVNTTLGECWEETGEAADDQSLFGRREKYGPVIPMGAGVLTAAVDVQDDRVEAEVVAWGRGEESWQMDYVTLYGSPELPQVWKDLEEYLTRSWKHESGAILKIACTCVDSGDHTKEVYAFVKPRQARRVFAVKGSSQAGDPLVSRPSIRNFARVKLFIIGTDTAKDSIYGRLKIEEFGPGYCHFPVARDEEYFKQLTAEERRTKYEKGKPVQHWIKVRARNEALDIRVYNMAALALLNANLDRVVANLEKKAKTQEEPASIVEESVKALGDEGKGNEGQNELPRKGRMPRKARGGGWIGGWRR